MKVESFPHEQTRALDTHRLVPTKYAEPLIFQELTDNKDELDLLYALESLTNQRLKNQEGIGSGEIGPDELLFGINHHSIINAAFSYASPVGSRFNSPGRGAWYCSDSLDVAIVEVIHHKEIEFLEIGNDEERVVQYRDYISDIAGNLIFLNAKDHSKYLKLDDYRDSQIMAEQALVAGEQGIRYPSVRHSSGMNYVAFRPHLVGNLRSDKVVQLTWKPGQMHSLKVLG
jgi:RES domain-containing protein